MGGSPGLAARVPIRRAGLDNRATRLVAEAMAAGVGGGFVGRVVAMAGLRLAPVPSAWTARACARRNLNRR